MKDRAIIAAEVMHEYDEKVSTHIPDYNQSHHHTYLTCVVIQFVTPRVNPIRSDACVQTHQSEMVNPFED